MEGLLECENGQSGTALSASATPELSHRPGFLFNNGFVDSHTGLDFSEHTDLSVVNPYGDFSFPFFTHDDQSAMIGEYVPDCTSCPEDAPATLATPTVSHELANGTAVSLRMLPGHLGWEPTTQADLLRTSSPRKRKTTALDDDDERNGFPFTTSDFRYGGAQLRPDGNLACLFYKMNPKRYMSCGERSISNISALGQHLRNTHKLKPLHCKDCFESFDDKATLKQHKEPGVCVPTGGCSVGNLCGLRGKRKGIMKTWYWYWKQLFPNLQPPSSPYTDGLEVVDQCMLSAIQRVIQPLELGTSSKTNLILGLLGELARWRQHPSEPLDHGQLRQCGGLPGSPARPWQEGPQPPTPLRLS